MALIELTVNVDRLASVLESAIPILSRISQALDRAYPPLLDRPSVPRGQDGHRRLSDAELLDLRRRRPRAALLDQPGTNDNAK